MAAVNVKLKNPNRIFYASDGQKVTGNRVVRFEDPVPSDVMTRLTAGFLVETKEDPTPEPESAPAQVQGPFMGELLVAPQGTDPKVQETLDAMQTRIDDLTGQVAELKSELAAAAKGDPKAKGSSK
jgi:hypothetical protein